MLCSSLSSLCLSWCIHNIFKYSSFFPQKLIIILYLDIVIPPGLLKFIKIIAYIKGQYFSMFLCILTAVISYCGKKTCLYGLFSQ